MESAPGISSLIKISLMTERVPWIPDNPNNYQGDNPDINFDFNDQQASYGLEGITTSTMEEHITEIVIDSDSDYSVSQENYMETQENLSESQSSEDAVDSVIENNATSFDVLEFIDSGRIIQEIGIIVPSPENVKVFQGHTIPIQVSQNVSLNEQTVQESQQSKAQKKAIRRHKNNIASRLCGQRKADALKRLENELSGLIIQNNLSKKRLDVLKGGCATSYASQPITTAKGDNAVICGLDDTPKENLKAYGKQNRLSKTDAFNSAMQKDEAVNIPVTSQATKSSSEFEGYWSHASTSAFTNLPQCISKMATRRAKNILSAQASRKKFQNRMEYVNDEILRIKNENKVLSDELNFWEKSHLKKN